MRKLDMYTQLSNIIYLYISYHHIHPARTWTKQMRQGQSANSTYRIAWDFSVLNLLTYEKDIERLENHSIFMAVGL